MIVFTYMYFVMFEKTYLKVWTANFDFQGPFPLTPMGSDLIVFHLYAMALRHLTNHMAYFNLDAMASLSWLLFEGGKEVFYTRY